MFVIDFSKTFSHAAHMFLITYNVLLVTEGAISANGSPLAGLGQAFLVISRINWYRLLLGGRWGQSVMDCCLTRARG